MGILDIKTAVRPVMYPELKNTYNKVALSHWTHLEVDVEPDLIDWQTKLSKSEKRIIGNLFKAFTEQESHVNDYWRYLAGILGHPEASNLATAFSNQETIHQYAYDLLESELPLSELATSAFEEDLVAQRKLQAIIDLKDIKDLPTSIAFFSGMVEGVSLYSSFATLLAFTKKGYLKAMQQILSWSTADEAIHSKIGIKLYKILKDEGYGEADPKVIYEGAKILVKNEEDFIRNAYGEDENLGFITLENSLGFIRHRANKKLMELGFNPIFENPYEYKELADYFYTMVEGKMIHDFFALSRNGTGYSSVVTQDFSKCKFPTAA